MNFVIAGWIKKQKMRAVYMSKAREKMKKHER